MKLQLTCIDLCPLLANGSFHTRYYTTPEKTEHTLGVFVPIPSTTFKNVGMPTCLQGIHSPRSFL